MYKVITIKFASEQYLQNKIEYSKVNDAIQNALFDLCVVDDKNGGYEITTHQNLVGNEEGINFCSPLFRMFKFASEDKLVKNYDEFMEA